MRILQHLKGHVGALFLIFLLLIGQAICDLALPTFTSVIVDVGIQQRGIQHAALSEMRAQTYQELLRLVDPDDRATFEAAYEQGEDGHYRLTQAGWDDIDALDEIEAVPAAILSSGMDGAGTQSFQDVSDEDIAQMKQASLEEAGEASQSIATQRAIAFARAEYEACGLDVDAMQLGYLASTGGLMLLVTLGMVACSVLVGLIASRTGSEIARSLRERLFTKVVSFSAEEINKFSTASLITRSTNDITQVQMVIIVLMRMVLYAPILGIGGIIMISTTNVSMSWIIVLAVALVIGLVATLFGITYSKFRIMQKLIDRVNLVSRESLTGVQVVRAFRREDVAQQRFNLASSDLMRTQLFTSRAMMFMFPGMTLIMNGGAALIVWTAAQQIDIGAMQVGEMIAFMTYAMVIVMSFLMMSTVAIMLPRANVAATRIDEVLHTQPSIVDPAQPIELKPQAAGYPVEFDKVTFHYGDAEQDVLHDISFTAQPGKTTAIIGGTGSGKSTVLNLIPRFYDVSSGSVRVAGVDVRDIRQSDLHDVIGYVPQQSSLFSGTIESNLKYAGPQVTDEGMREAARIAQASGFVEAHEDGYAREVAQGGTNVSGGQRQRLSIARAIAKQAPILLFDDSFSALDYKTDQALRAELRKTTGGATVIIVAQRIATVLHADQIVVLDRGRIVGIGTHEELLASCEVYQEIAKSQLSPDELGVEGGVR